MDGKTTEWRAGPNVCRCCLTEGCYKDISTEYFWMGKREVYAEMLSDTLNVSIAYSQSGGPNSNSRLICELCISRLRDASDFKRQVLECEKTFMQHLDAGTSNIAEIEIQVDAVDDVKLERVKQEKRLSDDDDDDDFEQRCGFDDDDDDLDDEPLTKLASKIPKKESVDILDLLDNTKATAKRKSSSKTKTVPAKKSKTVKKEPIKAGASKLAAAKTEKKKKEFDPIVEARQNAKIILRYTTAYPFRIPANKMMCVYCCDDFEEPAVYREHMRKDHYHPNVQRAFSHAMGIEEYLKVDCTDLGCKLCAKKFPTITSIAEHLVLEHDKHLNLSAEIGLQIFKLGAERWVCATCSQKFPSIRCLSRHNNGHYHKYTCETCGKSYICRDNLNKHIKYSHSEEKICIKCKKSFPNIKERRAHVLASKRCWPYSCSVCGQRFISKRLRQNHITEVHKVENTTTIHKCPECDKTFAEYSHYRTHFIITHTNENYVCQFCGIKFASKSRFEGHKVLHTREKRFHCTSCSKSFLREKNLKQHMWIHSETKRFHCDLCNRPFNQRVSWKTHMKSYHPELVDF